MESRIIFAGAAFRRTLPILVLLDMHEASLAAIGRSAAEGALENCARLLEAARVNGIPVAHCRRIDRINSCCGEAERDPPPWLKGFMPRTNEMVFERELASCYTARNFDRLVCHIREPRLLLAGLSTGIAFVATALDARDHAHPLDFVADASASPRSPGVDQMDPAIPVMDHFADVIGTAAALEAMAPYPWLDKKP